MQLNRLITYTDTYFKIQAFHVLKYKQLRVRVTFHNYVIDLNSFSFSYESTKLT